MRLGVTMTSQVAADATAPLLHWVCEGSPPSRRVPRSMSRARLVGVAVVFVYFLLGGIAHFALTELEMTALPPLVPWPREVVLVSGVFELLGAAGLLWHRTRRAAGIGLFVLTIAVTPANLYMLARPDLFPIPYWLLVLRIPLQVGLLALIAWSTWSRPGSLGSARTQPRSR